jgi:hypothetical protein
MAKSARTLVKAAWAVVPIFGCASYAPRPVPATSAKETTYDAMKQCVDKINQDGETAKDSTNARTWITVGGSAVTIAGAAFTGFAVYEGTRADDPDTQRIQAGVGAIVAGGGGILTPILASQPDPSEKTQRRLLRESHLTTGLNLLDSGHPGRALPYFRECNNDDPRKDIGVQSVPSPGAEPIERRAASRSLDECRRDKPDGCMTHAESFECQRSDWTCVWRKNCFQRRSMVLAHCLQTPDRPCSRTGNLPPVAECLDPPPPPPVPESPPTGER